jgi:hypothetical protein
MDWSSNRNWQQRILIGILIGFIPVAVSWKVFLLPGFPLGGEVFSNLVPALHARNSILSGKLPIYTELFFSGRYQFANPLWYGLYPPAWVLFISWIPMPIAAKILLAAHLIATSAIAYYFTRDYLSPSYSALISLLWVSIIGFQFSVAHFEKIFAWPWFVMAAYQLLPDKLENDSSRAGLLAGFSIGFILLSGANYYFVYVLILILPVAFINRAVNFVKYAIGGSVIGLPHILFSIIPVIVDGTSRSHDPGYGLYPHQVFQMVIGIPRLSVSPYQNPILQGYAVIGIGAVILAILGGIRALRNQQKWAFGVGLSAVIGALLVGQVLYFIPYLYYLRTAARANVIIAASALLFVVYFITKSSDRDGLLGFSQRNISTYRILVTGLLVISVVQGGVLWYMFDNSTTTIDDGQEVADYLVTADCDSAWISSTPSWSEEGRLGVSSTELGYSLTEAGIAVRAFHYGSIGQEWEVKNQKGELTFEALITPTELPANQTVKLTGSDSPTSVKGEIETNNFQRSKQFRFNKGYVYVYTVNGTC